MRSLSRWVARHLRWVGLVLIAVAGWLGARGLAEVGRLAMLRGLGRVAVAANSTRPGAAALPLVAKTADAILLRNPFDSLTGSLLRTGSMASDANPTGDPYAAPTCGNLRVSVIAASSDADWSFAALSNGDDGKFVLRRRGGEVFGRRVEFVAADRVFLRDGDGFCQVELWRPSARVAPAPIAVHPPSRPVDGGLDPTILRGIVRTGPSQYRIDRSVVERIMEDQSELIKSGSVLQEKQGDRPVGLRLLGVRPDRLLGVLGLASGDVVRTLNGYDLSNPQKMLEAYARLREATRLTLEISRGNQPMTFDYSIE